MGTSYEALHGGGWVAKISKKKRDVLYGRPHTICTILCRPPYAGLSLDIRRRNNAEGARPCLCHVAPPTAVGGVHNSPVANGTAILKRLHLYNQSGVFYLPWHRHQVEGTPTIFSVLSEKTRAISGKVFCPGTQSNGTDRPRFERSILGSSVRLANHSATPLHGHHIHIDLRRHGHDKVEAA